jgi:hypothetical protein
LRGMALQREPFFLLPGGRGASAFEGFASPAGRDSHSTGGEFPCRRIPIANA